MPNRNPNANCLRGQRYDAEVPDTLDLADRMSLAVNALTGVWFPEEKWALALSVDYSRRPAVLTPNKHGTDAYMNVVGKFMESLTLCRLGSRSDQNLDVDANVLDAQLSFLGDDGLSYCPADTLPHITEPRPYSEVWGEGRLILAFAMMAQVDDDPRWNEICERKIDRMMELSREKEDFRFLWRGRYRHGETVPPDADEPSAPMPDGSIGDKTPGLSMLYSVGALGHGAAVYHAVTGHEDAGELARGLSRWALARKYTNPDGRYKLNHFHHSSYPLLAMCRYALTAGDVEVLERVDACYRWLREMGDPLIGFFPGIMPGDPLYLQRTAERQGNTAEICEVVDMVCLALHLTDSGVGDYWDDVDRWVRNFLTEGQVTNATFLDDVPDGYFNPNPAHVDYADTRNIAERSVGSFLGWMRTNDGLDVRSTDDGPKLAGHGIMHCCTAALATVPVRCTTSGIVS